MVPQPNLLQLAKQGESAAIAALINRSLQPKGIVAKASIKEGCLQIMLESVQAPDQVALTRFIRDGIIKLEIPSITIIKIYGRATGEEFPAWIEEFRIPDQSMPFCEELLTSSNNIQHDHQLKTNTAREALEQFMILKARTSIGISYNDLPPVLGTAKLAVQKFERSSDVKISPYMADLVRKIMLYYEISLDCLGKKVQRTSVGHAVFIGLGSLAGISADEPLGQLMTKDFPEVSKSFTGLYNFDTVLSALWLKAGELTDELDDILSKPIDSAALNSRREKLISQTNSFSPELQDINEINHKKSYKTNSGKRAIAIISAIFLGAFGAHKFILGYYKEGIIMLLFTLITSPIGGILVMFTISLIEAIIYLSKSDQAFTDTYVTSKKGWF